MAMNPKKKNPFKQKITNKTYIQVHVVLQKPEVEDVLSSGLRPYLFKNWLWKKRPGADPRFCCSSSTSNASIGWEKDGGSERTVSGGGHRSQVTSHWHTHYGSMGLVYTPTWMVDFYGKCRWIYHTWILWDTITVVGGTVDTCMRYSTSWVLAGLPIATLKLQSAELIKRSQW